MDNNWFKNPGDIEEPKTSISGTSYFKAAGDLPTNEPSNSMSLHFTIAGDIETPKQTNSFNFVEKEEELKTPEEIKAWLKTVVSGEKKANHASVKGLEVTGAGQKFVSIDELKDMVKNGDNIIRAEYFDNMNMVMVEFESFSIPSKSR